MTTEAMKVIKSIQMYADVDVQILSGGVEEDVLIKIHSEEGVRFSIQGDCLTIESQGNGSRGEQQLPRHHRLSIKFVGVCGDGTLRIPSKLTNGKLCIKVFHTGGLDLSDDGNTIYKMIKISNHGPGRIRGDGSTTEAMKIENTGSGIISGFLVEGRLAAVVGGSGQITIDKFSDCLYCIKKLPLTRGTITFTRD